MVGFGAGSEDPDPYQNETDPQHWYKVTNFGILGGQNDVDPTGSGTSSDTADFSSSVLRQIIRFEKLSIFIFLDNFSPKD